MLDVFDAAIWERGLFRLWGEAQKLAGSHRESGQRSCSASEANPANYVTAPPRGGGSGHELAMGVASRSFRFLLLGLRGSLSPWHCLSRQSTGTCVPSPTSRLVERARGKGARGHHIADVSLPVLGISATCAGGMANQAAELRLWQSSWLTACVQLSSAHQPHLRWN